MLPTFRNAKQFFITPKIAASLQDLLASHLPQHTDIDTLIRSGGVWLGKKRLTSPQDWIEAQQTLKVFIMPFQGKFYSLSAHDIVLDHPDFLVVHKPAHLTTVPDRSNTTYNLTQSVTDYFRAQHIPYTPTPCSRLDFMVSGLVIFAKHKAAERDFFKLTQQRAIKKYYVARLQPMDVPPLCLRVQTRLDFGKKARVFPLDSAIGKSSESLFILRDNAATFTEYGVVLLTGRRHQIRCHAAYALSPILGDSLYGSSGHSGRIQLACVGLNFSWKGKRFRIRHPYQECS